MNIVKKCLGLIMNENGEEDESGRQRYATDISLRVNRHGTLASTAAMLIESQKILRDFYRPYNSRLVKMELLLGSTPHWLFAT